MPPRPESRSKPTHRAELTTVDIALAPRAYRIHIGPGARRTLPDLLRKLAAQRVLLVADRHVASLHLEDTLASLPDSTAVFEFEPGEQSKSLDEVAKLYDAMLQAGITRGDLVLTLGGGVASDLGGFAAATWMRGVRFVPIPTSLEAAIDAAIGGKTGVNHAGGKNLVGAFHQPAAVVVDTDCLSTLPEREFAAGLAESIKHAMIRDGDFFAWHEQHLDEVHQHEPARMAELIARNCRIKADVVARDERESGLRMILNFGHTIGHAFEHLLNYALRHGECVALGMIAAAAISERRGMLAADDVPRVTELLARARLPVRLPSALNASDVFGVCRHDKKHVGNVMNFILLSKIGEARSVTDVRDAEIEAALDTIAPR